MNCEGLTGLRQRACEGWDIVDNQRVQMDQNKRERLLAMFNGGDVPPRNIKPTRKKAFNNSKAIESQNSIPVKFYGDPGTRLKEFLDGYGITKFSGCKCQDRESKMNINGLGWCKSNKEEIVSWLVEAAKGQIQSKSSILSKLIPGQDTIIRPFAEYAVDQCFLKTELYLENMTKLNVGVAVTTSPREEYLLDRCLESLYNSGFDDITVFAEPDSPLPDVSVVQREHKYGAWYNWIETLREMISRGHDNIMIVQDDTVFCKGVPQLLHKVCWPNYDCAAIQLCLSCGYKNAGVGISKMPTYNMLGAWATIIPRFRAIQLYDYAKQYGWRGKSIGHIDNLHDKKAIDNFIGESFHNMGLNCYILRPSPVLHKSNYSTLGHGDTCGDTNHRCTFEPVDKDEYALSYIPGLINKVDYIYES